MNKKDLNKIFYKKLSHSTIKDFQYEDGVLTLSYRKGKLKIKVDLENIEFEETPKEELDRIDKEIEEQLSNIDPSILPDNLFDEEDKQIVEIDLQDYRDPNSSVLIKNADKIRKESKIDELEEQYDRIKIIVPKDIYSITPKFFAGLLYNVVKKLGREKFHEKFTFHSDCGFRYEMALEESITRILRNVEN